MAKGELQTGGRKRKVPDAARIAARVKRFKFVERETVGVQPLNPGFFKLEQMRAVAAPKRKLKSRAKLREL
jgi:hypothetical protein